MEGEESSQSTASPFLRPAPSRPSRLVTILSRASGRRGPSMLVRETAALQLEDRRANWSYSRPVVALDIAWNTAFAIVAVSVLCSTTRERPSTPLRVWVAGYSLQCVVHVLLVWVEYRRRQGGGRRDVGEGGRALPDSDTADSEEEAEDTTATRRVTSIAKRCETLNTSVSFLWWIVGFYWVLCGGQNLLRDAPRLYWLTVVFLSFDVFFTGFCIALACIIGIALCCCLPCVIAILYAMAGQEGASDADISFLPRYKYSESCEDAEKTAEEGVMIPLNTSGRPITSERVLLHIYLFYCVKSQPYCYYIFHVNQTGTYDVPTLDGTSAGCATWTEDGVELHALPCNHHFHSSCIVKWLMIHATCPLCKYNILKGCDVV